MKFLKLFLTKKKSTEFLPPTNWKEKVLKFIEKEKLSPRPPLSIDQADQKGRELKTIIDSLFSKNTKTGKKEAEVFQKISFLFTNADLLRPAFQLIQSKRVLFCGQAYYNAWYLSRELRQLGWRADVYNWDTDPKSQIYYHGEDFLLGDGVVNTAEGIAEFYYSSLFDYDYIHFSNTRGISFGHHLQVKAQELIGEENEIRLLKRLGKKIIYSNNGCHDGVSQTAFAQWGPDSVCSTCRWQNEPAVCSDEKNLAWGKFRNEVADYQCLLGGNRADFNLDRRIHEVPEFYCLDEELWRPDLEIPDAHRLPAVPSGTVRLFHAIGNKKARTRSDGKNIKSSHVYEPLIRKLQAEGYAIEMLEPTDIPNREIRYYQAQADIVLDMLGYGWFGALAREAMMLGKPVICFIRPEWLADVRRELPEYADTLPIVSATPSTVEGVLKELILSPEKRKTIGFRSREFACKWHGKKNAAGKFDKIYLNLKN